MVIAKHSNVVVDYVKNHYKRVFVLLAGLFYIAVYVCTILLAIVVHKVDQKIIKAIQKR